MARAKHAKDGNTPTKSSKQDRKMDAKYSPKKQNVQRVKKYKQAKRAKQVQALESAIRAAESPASKKALAALEAQVFQPWKFRGSKGGSKVAQLEKLVKEQQEEIRGLRKMVLVGKGGPKLEPVSPNVIRGAAGKDDEPDSSPVKIREQLANDIAPSNEEEDENAQEVVLETTEGAEPEQMDVEPAVVPSIEDEAVEYPTLPSVEVDDVQETSEEIKSGENGTEQQQQQSEELEASQPQQQESTAAVDTPSKPPRRHTRASSADSHAGTPRNVRRSPRKRMVKKL
ncbi:hypothetical protein M406DRAFT_328241 [Cryphonectria parasitica EP155]|uniref:Uncharacterized protein n=1 Tax=Cryphonectria parasitica (strain ATCC 38755 / EP155) TaxID=660469 RepID=A0A9P4Y695_CRYP1|nr:uncharacterized protein M406DRAFT_328241 [Cryphonectria parasitica EP155]KAF3767142.1 hypothetical protein M406DRAFT_328241 [Cryphonectria parasitica EP155]